MRSTKTLLTALSIFCLAYSFSLGQTFNETQGTNAGNLISTGDYNAIYGDSAGARLTTGSGHVMMGTAAGSKMISTGTSIAPHLKPTSSFLGSQGSVIIGHAAGYNSTGFDNVMIGPWAGWSNTTGNDNVFIGTGAGRDNTFGSDNVYIGNNTGMQSVDGRDNTFVGDNAGKNNISGDDNTAIGSTALFTMTTGYRNTAVGNEAGYDITTGFFNTCIGDSAGVDMSGARSNTMIGHASGAATEHGSFNTFVGDFAGWDNNRTNNNNGVNAHSNTYLGARAGFTNRDGNHNLVLGAFADFEVNGGVGQGVVAPFNNRNVVLGSSAIVGGGGNRMVGLGAWSYVAADHSIAIGDSARNSGVKSIAIGSKTLVSGENSIAIGSNATVTASNEVFIGNNVISSIGGVVNWTATSDQRFKSNVEENVIGLEFIKQLRPVTYNMDAAAIEAHYGRELPEELKAAAAEKAKIRYTGFLAQEVEYAAEASGYDFSGIDRPKEGKDAYGIRYAEFVVPLVKAIQEQQEIIEGQKNDIQAYQSAIEELNVRVNQMEAVLLQVAPENQVTLTK